MIAKDETQDYEQLTVLANKCGATIPKGIDARKNPAIRTLMQAKGNAFDRDFLRDEIADHGGSSPFSNGKRLMEKTRISRPGQAK